MEYIYENHDVKGLEVSEASSSQLAEGVLAKVKGPSFFLDGFSRNGRFYPKELWENTLKNAGMKSALDRGLMFGCIGHPKDYSLDELLESGKVSHKVTDIYIDKKTGEGVAEYEILDTPAGRILNTVLRSGSEMYVSTRAFGGFTKETKNKGGKSYKVLDSSNFVIESIDFVIQPGFLETNPKLMESLSEEFKALSEDKHQIECVDGLCGLKFENVNEDEPENENNEDNELNKDVLEQLSKEEIISMLENVVNENKLLAQDSTNEDEKADQGDMLVSAKLMMNYVSYVELLTKLVRYDVEYEKYYDELIEFLDKDSKLTTEDMSSLDEICANILKEKDVEESIVKVCERITELAEKINSDGEENKDDKDKESEKNAKTTSDDEDNSPEIKAEETFVDFMLDLKTKVVEKIVKVQDEELVNEMRGQLIKMKEATKFLTKKLDEEMSKAPKVEKVTETHIEYKVPEDIHEKMIENQKSHEALVEQVKEESNKRHDLKEILESKIDEYQELEEEHDTLVLEFEALENSISEKEESDNGMFREILEDKQKEFEKVQELFDDMESQYQTSTKELEKVDKQNEQLRTSLVETKANYYASMYKLELPVVKKVMETHSSERDVKEALAKEQKLARRSAPMPEAEIPEYKPNAQRSQKKSRFLENLTK